MKFEKKPNVRPLAYRIAEAAEACAVSPRTFSDWIKSDNPPPHFRRGGAVLFPIRDLRDWLSEQAKPKMQDSLN